VTGSFSLAWGRALRDLDDPSRPLVEGEELAGFCAADETANLIRMGYRGTGRYADARTDLRARAQNVLQRSARTVCDITCSTAAPSRRGRERAVADHAG
jgi:hypothetical protein